MSPRAIADARRAGGLLLAFVLVISQARAWCHAVAISHVACLEHGEAMHGPTAPAGVAPGAARPPEPGQTGVRADLATAGGHDHCANAALLRWRDVALAAPAGLAPLLPRPRSLIVAAAPDGAQGAVVYRLAPKTSPPIAGA